MGSEIEFEKRMNIVNEITSKIKDFVEAIIVGGSVGYGNVRENSDIDMSVIIDKKNLQQLISAQYFKGKVPDRIIELFSSGEINLFWVTNYIKGIEVNMFVYGKEGYENHCTLQGSRTGFIQNRPSDNHYGYSFEGEKLPFDRNVQEIEGGYLYSHPALANGKYYGHVPRDDFFHQAIISFQKNNFFNNLQNEVWRSVILQLKKEYGPEIDLSKSNILKSIFLFNWEKELGENRMSEEIKEKIMTRTKEELGMS